MPSYGGVRGDSALCRFRRGRFPLKFFRAERVKAFADIGGMAASMALPASTPARDFPHFITDVARVCGVAVASKIMARWGGMDLYVPTSPLPHHEFSKVVGIDAAERIAVEVGCGKVAVPLGPNGSLAIRRALIERMVTAGDSTSAICRAAKCCDRTVQYARARLRREGKLL